MPDTSQDQQDSYLDPKTEFDRLEEMKGSLSSLFDIHMKNASGGRDATNTVTNIARAYAQIIETQMKLGK